jgi:hypothetical protein
MSILQQRRLRAGIGILYRLGTWAIDGATQANQEAETTNKVVTSDVQHFGPSAAKCWAYVTVSAGTPTLQTSYNITSITDSGAGDLTITIATDFSSANWCGGALQETASASSGQHTYANSGKTAGAIELYNYNGAALVDPFAWNFWAFGDQ